MPVTATNSFIRPAELGVLSADGVTCLRGERLIFTDLCIRVSEGNALILRGANGSGKSTLLRILAGFIRPENGKITWNDIDVNDSMSAYSGNVIYVGHSDPVKAALTVSENLRFWSELDNGMNLTSEALDAFNMTDLENLPAYLLSAGQRRKLNLARLAITKRMIWILDEPTTNLDEASIDSLVGLMKRHLQLAGIIVIATHLQLDLRSKVLSLSREAN